MKKENKSWYKKWWAITIFILIGIITSLFLIVTISLMILGIGFIVDLSHAVEPIDISEYTLPANYDDCIANESYFKSIGFKINESECYMNEWSKTYKRNELFNLCVAFNGTIIDHACELCVLQECTIRYCNIPTECENN